MLPAESTGKGGKTIFPGRLERFYQWDAILRDLKSVEPADYIGEAYGIWSFDQRNGGRTQTLIISCARIDFLPTMVFQVRQFQSSIRCLIISFSFFLKSPIASWLILLLNWTSIQSFSSLILNNISIAQILNLSENVTASFVRVDEHSKIEIPIFSNFENIYIKKKRKETVPLIVRMSQHLSLESTNIPKLRFQFFPISRIYIKKKKKRKKKVPLIFREEN